MIYLLLEQFLKQESSPRILLLRLSSIGDVLQASPVAYQLRKAFPTAYIAWLVESKSQDVIKGNSNLDDVIVWPRKEWNDEAKKTGDYLALAKKNFSLVEQIRKGNFQISIDLHGMYRSALIGYLSGAKYRLCLPNPPEHAEYFANVKTRTEYLPTVFSRFLTILKELGLPRAEPEMEMPISEADDRFALEFMAKHGLKEKAFFILNPATSQPEKCWPADKFARLGDMLAERYKLPIVIFGAKSDRPLTKKLAAGMRHKPIDASGQLTLKQLAAITKQAGIFISGDTGPLYIAQAVNTPTVAIFGATNADYYNIGKESSIFIQGKDNSTFNVTTIEVYRAIRQLNIFKEFNIPLSYRRNQPSP